MKKSKINIDEGRNEKQLDKNAKKTRKKSVNKVIRMKLWEIQIGNTLKGNCYACNKEIKIDNFDTGHIISEKNGGETNLENLRVICRPCNLSCGTMNLDDFKKLLDKSIGNSINKENDNKNKESDVPKELRYLLVKDKSIYYQHPWACLGTEETEFTKMAKQIGNDDDLWKKWKKHSDYANEKPVYLRYKGDNKTLEFAVKRDKFGHLLFDVSIDK